MPDRRLLRMPVIAARRSGSRDGRAGAVEEEDAIADVGEHVVRVGAGLDLNVQAGVVDRDRGHGRDRAAQERSVVSYGAARSPATNVSAPSAPPAA